MDVCANSQSKMKGVFPSSHYVPAAAIYATEGIEEDAKLPTLEAAILLTSTASGALMMALGQASLGNIVRLLPSPVTGRGELLFHLFFFYTFFFYYSTSNLGSTRSQVFSWT